MLLPDAGLLWERGVGGAGVCLVFVKFVSLLAVVE